MQTQVLGTPSIIQIEENVWKVPSSRNTRVRHTVRLQPDGTLRCNCEWGSSPTGYAKTGKPCRHCKEIAMMNPSSSAPQSVVDPEDEDPFAGMEIPAPKAAPVSLPVALPVALPEAHKPTLAELEDLFTYFS